MVILDVRFKRRLPLKSAFYFDDFDSHLSITKVMLYLDCDCVHYVLYNTTDLLFTPPAQGFRQ